MKKRVLLVVLSVVILAMSLVACGKTSDIPKGMKVASEKNNAFYTMYVPEDWQIIETNSNVTLAQAKDNILGTTELKAVTVNAMFWGIDSSLLGEEKKEDAYKAFYEKYQSDMKGTFEEFYNLTNLEEAHSSKYREGAKEYSFVAMFGNIYYKYYMTVIVHNQMYYAITFNFPQNNIKLDDNGNIVKSESWEDADFDDNRYSASIEDIVVNFKPEK